MAGLEDDLDACADRLMERLNAAQGDDAPFQQADPLELAARLMEVAAANSQRHGSQLVNWRCCPLALQLIGHVHAHSYRACVRRCSS